ncbi:MAG: DUF488 family protein [Myxococcota bacterium]
MRLRTRRIYEPARKSDGRRILIDRLWPRGLSRERAQIDDWARDIAVSDALRRWYDHRPERWPEFRRRYFAELDANAEAVEALRDSLAKGTNTLLFGSRESERNNATALRDYLLGVSE